MKQYDVLILGGGPSGLYAAIYAALRGLRVLLVEANATLGGQPRHLYGHKQIVDYPAVMNATGESLIANLQAQLAPLTDHVEIVHQKWLVAWKRAENELFIVDFNDATKCQVRAIVIATGIGTLQPIKIDPQIIAADVDLQQITYRVDDFCKYKNKHVIILGGGDAAVEWAAQLADPKHGAKCASICIIHRRDTYRASWKYVAQMRAFGVRELLSAQLVSIKPNQLVIKNTEQKQITLPYDVIIVQYSLRQIKVQQDEWKTLQRVGSRFVTDRNLQTNEQGIYAIGAATHYPGRPDLLIVGMAEAAIAIKHISDQIHPYPHDYILDSDK